MSLLDRFRQDPKELVGSEAKTPLGWTRTLGRIAIGVLTLGLLANAPMIPAVAGLLGVSGAALIKLLRKRTTEFDLASINIIPKGERFLALSDRLDRTRLWIRSATYGAILSIVPVGLLEHGRSLPRELWMDGGSPLGPRDDIHSHSGNFVPLGSSWIGERGPASPPGVGGRGLT